MSLVPLRMGGSDLPRSRPRLSQMPQTPYLVVVTDPRGNPYPGARVSIQGQAMPQTTDSNGIATFAPVPPGQVLASVKIGDLRLNGTGTADATMFVTVPVCAPGPLITNTELLAMGIGGALTAGGMHWKKGTLSTLGEILVSASLFSLIYRASCRW